MTKAKLLSLGVVGFSVASVVACSGGGGSGGGGSSSSMLQTNKMSCSGSACIGGGSLFTAGSHIEAAVDFYDGFNQQMIPALNRIISIVEQGAANAGAESCDDVQIGFSGQTTAYGVTYNAKTAVSSATAPSEFTTTTMDKTLAAEVASSNTPVIQADVACGNGTAGNPLVARVIGDNGTAQLNAWFEKGGANHIRILMIVKSGGTNYAAWFKTDDGNAFEIVLASTGVVYKAVGNKQLNVVQFHDGTSATCLNATTGAASPGSCGSMDTSSITVTGLPDSLVQSNTVWSSVSGATLLTPTY